MKQNSRALPSSPRLSDYDAVFFDLDGVLWLEGAVLPGAAEALERVRKESGTVLILTNKSTASRRVIAERMQHAGLEVPVNEVINSPFATAVFLRRRYGPVRIFAMGSPGALEELEAQGHLLTENDPEFVVVGYVPVRELTETLVGKAVQHVRKGAMLIGCNRDKGNPLPDGSVSLGSFYTVGTVERACGTDALVIGKPETSMFDIAFEVARTQPERCLMVGDMIESDIRGGKQAGMDTALVLSGFTPPALLKRSTVQPDFVLESVAELR